jgi:hypothetical protein
MFKYTQTFVHKYLNLQALKYVRVAQTDTHAHDEPIEQDIIPDTVKYEIYTRNASGVHGENESLISTFYVSRDSAQENQAGYDIASRSEWQALTQIIQGKWYKGLPNNPDVVYKVERLLPYLDTTDESAQDHAENHIEPVKAVKIWGYAPNVDSKSTATYEYFRCVRALSYLELNSAPAVAIEIKHALTTIARNMGLFQAQAIKDVYGQIKLTRGQLLDYNEDRDILCISNRSTLPNSNPNGEIHGLGSNVYHESSAWFRLNHEERMHETRILIYYNGTWASPIPSLEDAHYVRTHDGYEIRDGETYLFEAILKTGTLKRRKVKNARPEDFAYFYTLDEAKDYVHNYEPVYSRAYVNSILAKLEEEAIKAERERAERKEPAYSREHVHSMFADIEEKVIKAAQEETVKGAQNRIMSLLECIHGYRKLWS